MKSKAVSGILLALFLLIMSTSRYEIPSVHAQEWADAISIEPSLAIVAVGQTVKVNVTITDVPPCFSYAFWIYYNSTVLELVSWTFDTDPANPLSPTQMAPAPGDRIDTDASTPGNVKLATQWKAEVPTYSGSGVAAQLTFNGTMMGNSSLIFDRSWTQWNAGSAIETFFETFNDGEIQVRPPTMGRAEYDYYVVAGHNMTPTLPPPALQPSGFTFTLEGFAENGTGLHSLGTAGYNFGNLTRNYRVPFFSSSFIYEGSSESEPTGSNWNAYVVVNITNNLGYTITIEDLTAEVTDGTSKGNGLTVFDGEDENDTWKFPISGENLANVSMVVLDTFDPWDYNNEDEVDYNTGEVHQLREDDYPDHYWAATGVIRPASMGRGPGSLLLSDYNGDAASTGHVAPKYGGGVITVAGGQAFTEYFGLCVLGDVAVGTQINATITVRFYYSPPLEGTTALVDVQMSNLQPMFPAFYKVTDCIFPHYENLNFNITVQNRGNVPINVTVDLYYCKEGSWLQIGSSQSALDLPVASTQLFNFYWNVRPADIPIGWTFLKANATATNEALTATCEFNIQMRCRLLGDVDGDGDIDVGDSRKLQLSYFTRYPEQGYLRWNNAAAYGPQLFTDMDGDLDQDIGDERKQQIHMFESESTYPRT